MNKLYIFIILITIICIYIIFFNNKLDQCFYNYKDIYPFLEILKINNNLIKQEIINLNKENWVEWPEKFLYEDGWKVLPFYGFGMWIPNNCQKCPGITNILKNIPGLKTALLSKLTANTKINPHQGWANLSNYILRCHYGIIVPDSCYMIVEDEYQQVKENEIIVFDDSKLHYAVNNSEHDRIILIIDIERPNNVEVGKSDIEDTTEIKNLISYFSQ